MKKFILASALITIISLTGLFAQQSVSLNSCFKPMDDAYLLFDFEGETSIEYWNQSYVKIEVEVNSNVKKTATFRELIKSGRYQIEYSVTPFTTLIEMPNLDSFTKVNGRTCTEEMTFKIYIPSGTFADLISENDDLITVAN